MDNITVKDAKYNFLIEEYRKCWEYIQFHYEQRDKSQRFYFIFVLGAASVVTALIRIQPEKLSNFPIHLLLLLIIPIFLLGILFLGQLIALRKTTTLFHKNIVTIRAQLLKDCPTLLPMTDNEPNYFKKGFNLFTALIAMMVTSFVLANGVLVIFLGHGRPVPSSLLFSSLAWVGSVIIQFVWYYISLKNQDKKYVPLFPKSETIG